MEYFCATIKFRVFFYQRPFLPIKYSPLEIEVVRDLNLRQSLRKSLSKKTGFSWHIDISTSLPDDEVKCGLE